MVSHIINYPSADPRTITHLFFWDALMLPVLYLYLGVDVYMCMHIQTYANIILVVTCWQLKKT